MSLLATLFFILCGSIRLTDEKNLSILSMGPFPEVNTGRDPGWDGGPALIPAARLAVDHINSRNDVLPGYTLSLLEADSGCSLLDKTRINFIDQVYHKGAGQSIVGMVGPGCSEATMAVADLITLSSLNLMQVSIATTPDINATKTKYKNSFRTVASSLVFVDIIVTVMDRENWTRVGALYDNLRVYHIHTYNVFRDRIGSRLNYSFGLDRVTIQDSLNQVRDQHMRVIAVFAGRSLARKILCVAYKMPLIYPTVQFLFIERVIDDFLRINVAADGISCTAGEMEEAVEGVILLSNNFTRKDVSSSDTASGFSYEDYREMYMDYLNTYLREINITEESLPDTAVSYSSSYYDAVWALALSVNKSADRFDLTEAFQLPVSTDVSDAIRADLEEITFQGMTGLITFHSVRRDVSNTRVMLMQLIQKERLSGVFDNGTLKDDGSLYFIPDTFDDNVYQIPFQLGVFIIIIAVLMVFILVALQIGFIVHSGHKVVKASSPHLNHLVFSGCYLYIVALLISTLQAAFPRTISHPVLYGVGCSMLFWCSALAFTLVFGTVCVKTWRVYRIFSHFKQGRVKYVSDEILLFFVSFLILIDVLVLTAWNWINPWYLDIKIRKAGIRYTCNCDNFLYWSSALFIYKGALMILTIFMSVLIKQVKREGFKSSKTIFILIYSLMMIYFIGVTLSIVFMETNPLLSYFGQSLVFILSVVVISVTLFASNINVIFFSRRSKGRNKVSLVCKQRGQFSFQEQT